MNIDVCISYYVIFINNEPALLVGQLLEEQRRAGVRHIRALLVLRAQCAARRARGKARRRQRVNLVVY